jgi:hypothetical protein
MHEVEIGAETFPADLAASIAGAMDCFSPGIGDL